MALNTTLPKCMPIHWIQKRVSREKRVSKEYALCVVSIENSCQRQKKNKQHITLRNRCMHHSERHNILIGLLFHLLKLCRVTHTHTQKKLKQIHKISREFPLLMCFSLVEIYEANLLEQRKTENMLHRHEHIRNSVFDSHIRKTIYNNEFICVIKLQRCVNTLHFYSRSILKSYSCIISLRIKSQHQEAYLLSKLSDACVILILNSSSQLTFYFQSQSWIRTFTHAHTHTLCWGYMQAKCIKQNKIYEKINSFIFTNHRNQLNRFGNSVI